MFPNQENVIMIIIWAWPRYFAAYSEVAESIYLPLQNFIPCGQIIGKASQVILVQEAENPSNTLPVPSIKLQQQQITELVI